MPEAPSELLEHAEHGAKDPFIGRVSMTVAVLAVLTAIVGSVETLENGAAITESSRAVLAQDKATDSWSFYQAKSLKKRLDTMAADQGGPKAAQYEAAAKKDAADEATIQTEAKKNEHDRDVLLESSERHERRHHRLAAAATLLEMGIAIATIAIISRKTWPWLVSVGLGLVGAAIGAWAWWGV